jgi:hypothetical protein
MSSIIFRVMGDRKFSQQKVRSLPLLLASFHATNALRRAMWSLEKKLQEIISQTRATFA